MGECDAGEVHLLVDVYIVVYPRHAAYIAKHLEVTKGYNGFRFSDTLALFTFRHIGHIFYILDIAPGVADGSPVGFTSITVGCTSGNVGGTECAVIIKF